MPPRIPLQPTSYVVPVHHAAIIPFQVRMLSASPALSSLPSRQRTEMFQWLAMDGADLEAPQGKPAYLGPMPDQPFPLNPLFRSQSVLDEDARELIWRRVAVEGTPLKVVSADLGVDIRRVAAVVRMKEVEKQWVAKGKPLARPYATAIMSMLPKTHYDPSKQRQTPHEPINDVPVHPYSMQQLFVPASESRDFTRADAAAAFHEALLPADARVPHQELIRKERNKLAGATEPEAAASFVAEVKETEGREAAAARATAEKVEKQTRRVESGRFEFRFKHVNADEVGGDGRSRKAFGHRYGAPLQDRKRGMVRIPTQVP